MSFPGLGQHALGCRPIATLFPETPGPLTRAPSKQALGCLHQHGGETRGVESTSLGTGQGPKGQEESWGSGVRGQSCLSPVSGVVGIRSPAKLPSLIPKKATRSAPSPALAAVLRARGNRALTGPLLSGSKPTQDLPPFRTGLPPAQLLHRAGGPTQASIPPCPRPLQTPDPHTPDLAPGPRLETGSVRTLPPLPASATWASGPLCTRSYPPPPPVATLSPSESTPEAATTGGLPQPSTRHTSLPRTAGAGQPLAGVPSAPVE